MVQRKTAKFVSYDRCNRSLRHSRGKNPSVLLSRMLRENAIYCDTDWVIYIQPRDEPQLIETGDKLGDIISEFRPSETIS